MMDYRGIAFRIIFSILTLVQSIVKPIFWLIYAGKKKKVPPIKNGLLLLSATDLADKIRKKQISSETVVKTYIERIKEVNPLINAVVQENYNEAINEARKVDKYLTKSSVVDKDIKKSKPLLGVPLTVKESCGLKGMEFSMGTLSRKGIKAESDGEVVSRLKASGAIPLLVSNTPELCMAMESINFTTGTTRNPYDTTRTSGGSSGGEGALLGAGASVIGIGSDIAGSIRYPAFANGIFGHKPSPRIIPIKGHIPEVPDESFPDYLVLGPLTRYAKDLKLMMNVIVDPQHKSSLRLNEKVNFGKLNVYFMEEIEGYFLPRASKEIKTAVGKAVEYLKNNHGMTVKTKKFPQLRYAAETLGPFLYNLKGIPNSDNKNGDASLTELMIELYRCITGKSEVTPFFVNTLLVNKMGKMFFPQLPIKERDALKQEILDALGDNGVLIFPTHPLEPLRHYFSLFIPHLLIYFFSVNVLGLPSTNVPCGLTKSGLPIGIQVIAAPMQDRLCLAVAEQLENCFGGWVPP